MFPKQKKWSLMEGGGEEKEKKSLLYSLYCWYLTSNTVSTKCVSSSLKKKEKEIETFKFRCGNHFL